MILDFKISARPSAFGGGLEKNREMEFIGFTTRSV